MVKEEANSNLGISLPDALEQIRVTVTKAIHPICPAKDYTKAEENFYFKSERTDAGRQIPAYYLVYFLFIDLLGFPQNGKFEKTAWSITIDFEGQAYLIEHRKFGVGIFVPNPKEKEQQVEKIVSLIKKGIKTAEPFFEWMAEKAVESSKLNVINNSNELFERYKYFIDEFRNLSDEADNRKDEKIIKKDGSVTSYSFPAIEIRKKAKWAALGAIDAFFSWTEHVFIHVAILMGRISTGLEIADLASAEWKVKYKSALNIEEPETKSYYDELLVIRNQLRNFMAHGAFGKQGEAFMFHSGAGAVPVLLPHQKGKGRFTFYGSMSFQEKKTIDLIEKFIWHLWSGNREPARIYIESYLPLVLTMASDGRYEKAMQSVEEMEEVVDYMTRESDNAANMDW